MEEYESRCNIEIMDLQNKFYSLAIDGDWQSVMSYM